MVDDVTIWQPFSIRTLKFSPLPDVTFEKVSSLRKSAFPKNSFSFSGIRKFTGDDKPDDDDDVTFVDKQTFFFVCLKQPGDNGATMGIVTTKRAVCCHK